MKVKELVARILVPDPTFNFQLSLNSLDALHLLLDLLLQVWIFFDNLVNLF